MTTQPFDTNPIKKLQTKLNWLTKDHQLVNMNFLNCSMMVGSQAVNITKENLHTLIASILS